MASLPGWVVLASPVVAFLSSAVSASVAAAAIRANNRNQREQRALQESIQRAEIEEERQTVLRTERREAYRTMARITTTVDPSEPYELLDLAECHHEIEMVTSSSEVQEASANLYQASFEARKLAREAWKAGIRPAESDDGVRLAVLRTHELRGRFVEAARRELGLPPRPMRADDPLEIRQELMSSGSQNVSRRPWWRRVFGR